MKALAAALAACLSVVALVAQSKPEDVACRRCGWRPPAAIRAVVVKNVDELERAADTAKPGDTILLADGRYALRRMIDVRASNVTIRGRSGDPAKVVLRGGGMTNDSVGVALSISASGATIADLTVRDVRYHAVQVRGEAGASGFTLHNARLVDAGQQVFKVSVSNNRRYADDGLVACSDFSYTVSAPSDYTNGVDLLAARGWTVRDNRFTRIRGPESGRWRAGPAILAWAGSADTTVERNVIVDSFRGIALGLMAGLAADTREAGTDVDHRGGTIRNNAVVNLNPWADEGIEANAAPGVQIEHNTVMVEGSLPWSISVRFASTLARVSANLTNRLVQMRDGGRAEQDGNVSGAGLSWFVDAPGNDLRLSPEGVVKAAGAGVNDWRPAGR